MKKSSLPYWFALLITVVAAYYQRVTGPTYPLRGEVTLGERTYAYRLPRSYGHAGDCEVRLKNLDPFIQATISFRRLGLAEPWHTAVMKREGSDVVGMLPHQPPAGRLEYFVTLSYPPQSTSIGMDVPIQIRFHGEVPRVVLVAHVTFMFAGMWASTAAGLLAYVRRPGYRKVAVLTVAFLAVGGLIFGPLMQHYAFGQYWTGVPFGYDLTDNKTLIALACWLLALLANWKKDRPRWIVAAAYLVLIVYSIPHSAQGSQLDYSTMRVKTG